MSWRVVWTPNAIQNLREIAHHQEERSIGRGVALTNAIFERLDALREFPYSAPRHPRMQDERVRRLVFQKHLVIYRVIEPQNELQILAVRHQRPRSLTPDELR